MILSLNNGSSSEHKFQSPLEVERQIKAKRMNIVFHGTDNVLAAKLPEVPVVDASLRAPLFSPVLERKPYLVPVAEMAISSASEASDRQQMIDAALLAAENARDQRPGS